jgi:septal ring factor EnvC (AmiA/AmiB activator)
MQTTLFRALQGINVPDDQAASVVERLDSHVESVVNTNIKAVEGKIAQVEGKIAQVEGQIAKVEGRVIAVEGKLTAVQTTLEAMRVQIQFMTVMLGVIGLAIAAGPVVARFIR